MIGRPAIHCALFKAVAVLVMTVVMLIGRESSELGDLPGAKSMGNGATATSEYDRLFLPHVARSAADSNVVDRVVIGESGKVSLSAGLMIVDLSRVYSNPVVFVGPLPRDVRKDADVALVSITDVQPNRFALRIKEAPGEQGLRPYEESVDYLVIEAGEWQIDDHVVLSVGVLSVSLSWTPVSFPVIFDGIPVILTQAQSDRSRAWLTTRQQSSSATGFQVRLQGDGAFSGLDEAETVGWLAVSAGQGVWDGIGYQARLESIKGSQRFEFGEQERVSPVFASIASSNGGNHAHLRQWNAYPYAAVSSVYFPTSTYHLPDDVVVEATVEATGLTSFGLAMNLQPITNQGYMALVEDNRPGRLSIAKQSFSLQHDEPGARQLLSAAQGPSITAEVNRRYHLNLSRMGDDLSFSVTAPDKTKSRVDVRDASLTGGAIGLAVSQEEVSGLDATVAFDYVFVRANVVPAPQYTVAPVLPASSALAGARDRFGGWSETRRITIDGAGADIYDLAVKLELSSTDIAFEQLASDGRDIRFVRNGDVLSHWLQEIDSAVGRAVIWVKVPFVSATQGAVIELLYGNPAAEDISDGRNTFLFFDDFRTSEFALARTDYFASNGSSAAIPDLIHPAAQEALGHTIIAYSGTNFDPYVTVYDNQRGTWGDVIRVGETPLQYDSHGSPALLVDDEGYIHVFYGAHNSAIKYVRSEKPVVDGNVADALSSFQEQSDVAEYGTYPQAMQLNNGDIRLFYRGGRGHLADWVYNVSRDGGHTWSVATAVLDGRRPSEAFYAYFIPGPDGRTIHATFSWQDEDNSLGASPLLESYHRYNAYYMYMDEAGLWRNASGAPLTLPLTKSDADELLKIYDSATEATHVSHPKVVTDGQGKPYILFTNCPGYGSGAICPIRLAVWDGVTWQIRKIGETDFLFDGGVLQVSPDGSRIDVYAVSGGTSGRGTADDRGGSIEHWYSSDGGANWLQRPLIDAFVSKQLYAKPQVVVDYTSTASKLVFSTHTNNHADFSQKVYLWGDEGFVTKMQLVPTVPYAIASTWRLGAVVEWAARPDIVEAAVKKQWRTDRVAIIVEGDAVGEGRIEYPEEDVSILVLNGYSHTLTGLAVR